MGTHNKSKSEKSIKAKVFLSYALMVVLITTLLYFTLDSFQKLTRSTDTLAQPNPRIALLHDIIFSIYNAESNIRAYTLNERESYLDAYFDELSVINERVDSLYMLAEKDAFIIETIDSINLQLLNKTRLLDQFIQIKRFDQSSVLYEKALEEILKVTEQEARVREVTHQSITGLSPSDTVTFNNEDISREKDNFFARVKNFFTGRSEDESEDREQREEERKKAERREAEELVHQIQTDSIIMVYRDTEELKTEIESTMTRMMESVLARQQNNRRMENNVLLEDKKVMDRIWHYITMLEDYERANVVREANEAHATVNLTTERILVIVVIALIILMLFSWLFVNDINKSRYYKKQLLREKDRAEELVQVKQRFMANMSHEIRTPLNSIIGFSRELQKNETRENTGTFSKAIHQSSVHLLGIVNDILDFSKIEAGRIELKVKPLNLKEISDEVYNTLSVMASEKSIDFTIDNKELKNPDVLGDALRIKQILLNIGSNAIKFTHKGSVKISLSDFVRKDNPDMTYLHMRIADTGIGIAKEDQEKIFDEFAQSDSQATRHHGGTGLGLSISKKLVDVMDGSIELFSQKGEGSVFSVHLPLKISESPVTSISRQHATIQADTRASILMIDDDHLNRLLFKSLFSPFKGISFFEAENALHAIEMLNRQKFDLVISDLQMPGMSGIELVKQVRSQIDGINNATPFLACTADVTSETIKTATQCGMNDYLIKPVDEILLLDKIRVLFKQPLPENNDDYTESEKWEEPESNKLFDLNSLKAFTGNDSEALSTILRTFTEDTRENIRKLEMQLGHYHAAELAAIVHKMSNMFEMLKAEKANEYLRKLNGLKQRELSEEELKQNISGLINTAGELADALEKEVVQSAD